MKKNIIPISIFGALSVASIAYTIAYYLFLIDIVASTYDATYSIINRFLARPVMLFSIGALIAIIVFSFGVIKTSKNIKKILLLIANILLLLFIIIEVLLLNFSGTLSTLEFTVTKLYTIVSEYNVVLFIGLMFGIGISKE